MLSPQYFEGSHEIQKQTEAEIGKKLQQIYDIEQNSHEEVFTDLSCFSLLLAASALSASLAEIFPGLLALDSQICLG